MATYKVRIVRTNRDGTGTSVSHTKVEAASAADAEHRAIAEAKRHQPGGPNSGYTYEASATQA